MTSKPTPKCDGNREERERRVTRQMTAADLDSRNPLHIPDILERILKLLPVQDLKSCRLVNKFWRDAALKPMQNNCRYIHVGGRVPRYSPGTRPLQDFKRLLECFTGAAPSSSCIRDDHQLQPQIPCTKFVLFTDIITANSSDKEKSIVISLLKTISPSVTEMVLCNGSEQVDFWNFVEELNFPSLKRLGFATAKNSNFCAFGQWMSSFITNSPLLKKIVFGGAVWDSSFSLVCNVLKAGQYLKLEELNIISLIENDGFAKLCEANWKLKKLNFFIYSTSPQPQEQWFAAFMRFLKCQSETLEDIRIRILTLRNYVLGDVPFPEMKRLKSLTIHGWGFGRELINYRKQMPSLNQFIVVSNEQNQFSDYLRAEIEPAQSVKKLGFFLDDPTIPTATAQVFLQAVRIFPNVTKLWIPACPVVLPIVFDYLSNLEEVTLQINDGDVCIDRMLTGLTEDGYLDALRRMRNWSRNFDDSDIRVGASHSPISVLSKLKVLKLNAEEPRPDQLEVTKVSICLALLKMPSLKILDLGQRMEPPDEMIPGRVLEEFRKHRIILWKLKDADNC